MQLQEKHPEKFVAITLNLDFEPGDETTPDQKLQDKVSSALTSREVACINLMCTESLDDTLAKYELLGLPAAVVFGPDGKVKKKYSGKVDYVNEVGPLVSTMIADMKKEPAPDSSGTTESPDEKEEPPAPPAKETKDSSGGLLLEGPANGK